MTILYGIPNCDTIKKARKYLDTLGASYQFHDFRADGISRELVESFVAKVGLEALVNKRSTTYRTLDDKENITTYTLVMHPTLIKRPVLVSGSEVVVGFNEERYSTLLAK